MFSPQIEEVSQVSARLPGVGTTVVPLSGVANDRPPDLARQAVIPPRLERSATPVNVEDQQVVKRSRGEGDEVMDIGVEEILGKQVGGSMPSEEGDVNQGNVVRANPSFCDMLMGGSSDVQKTSSIPDLDVDIQEEDVKFSMGGGGSHKLGEWYYLARFAVAEDVSRVLTGGPWLVYGSYLTVQPWSRDFSTELDHPDKIVVWARLPGLPYRYYTKSMFRYIAGVIGRIVQIDYNTEEGKRGRFAQLAIVVDLNKPLVSGILLDGVFQKVEYKGLPTICYSCGCYGHTYDACKKVMEEANAKQWVDTSEKISALPKDRFGPWMQVSNRRAGKVSENKIIANNERLSRGKAKVVASRFAVLASDVNEIEIREEELSLGEHGVSDVPVKDSMVAKKVGGDENRVVLRGYGSETLGIGSNKTSTKDDQGVKGAVAAKDVVIQEPVTLNADAHTAVWIVERGADLAPKKGVGRRNASGLTEVAVKGNPRVGGTGGGGRVGNQVRRKQIARQPSRVGLDDWWGIWTVNLRRVGEVTRFHHWEVSLRV
ncbi:hypothetical protein GQ457_07G002590 [Hibiscus cannabinus]